MFTMDTSSLFSLLNELLFALPFKDFCIQDSAKVTVSLEGDGFNTERIAQTIYSLNFGQSIWNEIVVIPSALNVISNWWRIEGNKLSFYRQLQNLWIEHEQYVPFPPLIWWLKAQQDWTRSAMPEQTLTCSIQQRNNLEEQNICFSWIAAPPFS